MLTMKENKHLCYYQVGRNNCFVNAYTNLHCHLKHLNLKIVVGSLGIGRDNNIHYEFGGMGKEYDLFKTYIMSPGKYSAHVWLEDENSNVYDYLTDYLIRVASIRRLYLNYKCPCSILGVSKVELSSNGLYYVPAKEIVQSLILADFKRHYPIQSYLECLKL